MIPITKRACWLALCSLLLFVGLTSCFKKDEAPKPTTGGISGTVSPVGSLLTVVATDEGGLTFQATPSAADGSFAFSDLKAGKYTLSGTPAVGYYQPGDRQLTVQGGETVNAGTIIVSSDGSVRSGTVSWTVGGVTYTSATPNGRIDQSNGLFSLRTTGSGGAIVGQLEWHMGQTFSGVGTYTLGNTPYISATYSRSDNSTTSTYQSTSGTIRVTAYDAAAGTMTGTFALTLVNNTGSVNLTNGTFSLRF